jgi:hypothetical protein
MRKRMIGTPAEEQKKLQQTGWLAVQELATLEVSSEDPHFPAESVFAGGGSGWRAGQPGPQTLRVLFDSPQRVSRIWLRFEERSAERAQEFTLRYSSTGAAGARELIRQQWNFNPSGSTEEVEDYRFELSEVTSLELHIDPDRGAGAAVASLAEWRIG